MPDLLLPEHWKPCELCDCPGCVACEVADGTEDGSFCLCDETRER